VPHPLLDPLVVQAVRQAAAEHRGRAWTPAGFTDLSHRASHPCGIFSGTPFSVFAKLGRSPAARAQFTAELRGFRLIRARAGVPVPVPLAGGIAAAGQVTLLLTEALPEGGDRAGQAADGRTAGDYAAIGRTLAGLHQVPGTAFGLTEFDGFFGPLPQSNQPVDSGSWADFFAERRLRPMLRLAAASGHLPDELSAGTERVLASLPARCGPDPGPALLHGDAQQNNFVAAAGGAVVIDVAPYYGHPEADLALVDVFSPVAPELWRGYAQAAPLDPGFAGRRELWRLPVYLAAVAVSGGSPFGRSFLPRLAAAVRRYR